MSDPTKEPGKPDAGKPPVRFDEGREADGHWPLGLSFRRFLPTLHPADYYPISSSQSGAGQLSTIEGPNSSYTLEYEYDKLGRVKKRTIDAAVETWAFDSIGRLSGNTNALGTFEYDYVGNTGRLEELSYPNGQKVLFTYFGNLKDRQLNTIEHVTSGAALLNRHTYDYATPGEITSWNQERGGGGASTLYGLGYDGSGQLVRANVNSGTKNFFYHYDPSGNRTGVQKQESGGSTIALTQGVYGQANVLWRLTGGGPTRFAGQLSEPASVTVNGVAARVDGSNKFEAVVPITSGTHEVAIVATDLTGNENTTTQTYQVNVVNGAGTEDFNYDFNGNLIQDGTKTYEWDAANRLIAINYTGTTKRTEFTYDGLGRRIKNVEKDDDVVTEEKNFIWSGLELCEQRDSNNAVTRRFYSQGEQIGGTSYYYQRDHLGSVRELTNSAEAVKARYDYDLWGNRSENLFTGSDAVESEFGFTGH